MYTLRLKSLLLSTVLLSLNAMGAEDKKPNEDGSEFKAPRLAGDSLPIAGLDQDPQSKEVNNFQDAFTKGSIKGLIRYSAQYRDSNLHLLQDADGTTPSSDTKKQQYTAIGGYLGYETAPWFNTTVGATFYTAHSLGNNPDDRLGLGGLNEEDGKASSYTVLGESYLKVQNDDHRLVFGRQEMPNYRFVSLSNIRFSPFTHQGTTYENSMFDGLQVNLAYINRQKDRNSEDFEGMVRAARVKTTSSGKQLIRGDYDPDDFDASGNYSGDNKSMSMLGLVYKQNDYTLEAWNYNVYDFVNTVYLYTDYSLPIGNDLTLTAAAQYANQQDIGDNVAGEVDTWFYGLKAQASIKSGMTFFVAYNEVDYNENSYDGGTIFVRWGTPQMFNSFQVQDSELAGTKSYGMGAQFELGKMGLVPNTVIRFRYADYNLPDNLSQTDARLDRTEATFDLRYSFTKNDGFGIFTQMDGLSLQFRIAYDDYDSISTRKANDYITRHGYDITNVTEDFFDTRLYVDYVF